MGLKIAPLPAATLIRPVGTMSAVLPPPLPVAQAARAKNPQAMRCERDMVPASPSGLVWNSPLAWSMPREARGGQRQSLLSGPRHLHLPAWREWPAGWPVHRRRCPGCRPRGAARPPGPPPPARRRSSCRVAARAWRLPLSDESRSWVIASPMSRRAPSRRVRAWKKATSDSRLFSVRRCSSLTPPSFCIRPSRARPWASTAASSETSFGRASPSSWLNSARSMASRSSNRAPASPPAPPPWRSKGA